MRITNFSVRHRIPIFVMMFGIFILGVVAYVTLPRESTPDIKVPLVTIAVPWPEASPEDVENSVTVPLERELKNLKGLKELTSMSSEGISVTTCEFDPTVPVEEALQKVREKFDRAKIDFPTDVEEETIEELSFSEFPIMIVTLFGADVSVLQRVAEDLEEQVESLPGVLDAVIVGGVEPQIEIEVDPEKLEAYKLPVNQLIETLRGENTDISAGGVDTGNFKPSVRIPGEFKTAADVESLVVHKVGNRPVYLRDVARAYRGYKDRISYARRDGAAAVQLTISKRAGANIIEITEMIKYGLRQAKGDFPADVDYVILTDESEQIRTMVTDLENNILSGLVLVLLVIFFALGIRNAIFVATAIPFSMLMSFFILQAMGVTLNMVVLFALILAQGMLVDNAIVIIENIYRHIGMNKSPIKAAMDATKEVAWPVIAATATTLGAFGPLLFWPGIMGEFMYYLPLTVVTTLLCSLFVALVINPTIAATFMRFRKPTHNPVKRKVEGFGGGILTFYERTLRTALKWPKAAMAGAFGFLVLTIAVYGAMGHGVILFPEVEPKVAHINITAAEGISLQKMDALTGVVERRLKEIDSPDIKGIETTVGGTGAGNPMEGGADATHLARITVSFKDQEDRVGKPSEWIERVRPLLSDLPGADFEVKEQAMGPPTGPPINVEISVNNQRDMAAAVQRVRRIVEDTPGAIDVKDNLRTGKPELRIRVDRSKAALLGLNTQWIGNFVKMLINGQRIGGYDEGTEERDIIVRLPAERRNDPAVLDEIRISDAFGNAIPLSTVCSWEYVGGPGTVRRKDGQRVMTVSAEVVKGAQPQEMLKEIEARINAEADVFPAGFKARFTGENEDQQEAADFLSKAFVIALLVIAFILVLQFNSALQSLIILSSVILSTIGVMIGLLVLSQPFSIIMTGVAIIALAGVVVNNAIVMIDYFNQLREIHGRSLLDAIIEGGRTRLRPVMLTAITTALGLAPMALGFSFDFFQFKFVVGGESSAWWAMLATGMIFGLLISTVMTLVLVPCAYLVTARWGERGRLMFRRIFGDPDQLADGQEDETTGQARKADADEQGNGRPDRPDHPDEKAVPELQPMPAFK